MRRAREVSPSKGDILRRARGLSPGLRRPPRESHAALAALGSHALLAPARLPAPPPARAPALGLALAPRRCGGSGTDGTRVEGVEEGAAAAAEAAEVEAEAEGEEAGEAEAEVEAEVEAEAERAEAAEAEVHSTAPVVAKDAAAEAEAEAHSAAAAVAQRRMRVQRVQRVQREQRTDSVRRLQRGGAALLEPAALFSLVVAATQRLNLWGLLYLLLVGWLRFAPPRGMRGMRGMGGMNGAGAGAGADARGASRLPAASWLGVRVLLGTAVALQLPEP